MLIVAGAAYELLERFYRNYQIQEAVAEMQQQARVAADLISREIRFSGLDPTGVVFLAGQPNSAKKTKATSKVAGTGDCVNGPHSAEKILEATPSVFHYLADINGNGTLNSPSDREEDIRYEWVGQSGLNSCNVTGPAYTLYRDTGGNGQTVAENVVYFKLAYFDEDGKELSTLSSPAMRATIRKVVMTVCARTDRPYPASVSIASSCTIPGFFPEAGYGTRMVILDLWLKNM